MSDQNPTPDAQRPDEPAAAPYSPPQYGQPVDGQPDGHMPPAYDQQAFQPPAQPYQAPQYGQAPQYSQTPHYPQQAYGQPTWDQQQQYAPPQQQPHPAPHYPAQPQQYPPAYQQWPQEPEQPKSQTLGIVGFGLVALCTVILAVVGYLIGSRMGTFMLDYGVDVLQNQDPTDPLIIALGQQVQGLVSGGMFATLGGIAGWVVSIVATTRRRGRTFGIWGIIVGILAPVLGFIAMVIGMWPAAQVLAG